MPLEHKPKTIAFSIFLLDPTQFNFIFQLNHKKRENIDEEERSTVKFNYSAKSVSMFFYPQNVPNRLLQESAPETEI